LKELIAWLKANPDKASQGTPGAGSVQHVAGVFFQKETGTRFQFVPYRGLASAMQDLLAGQIDLMFDSPVTSMPQVRTGAIKAYAVTAKSRGAAARDIPTVDEAGLPEFYASSWYAIWAPKGTPKGVIARLNAAAVEGLADPCGNGLPTKGWKFHPSTSRHQRRSATYRRLRSKSGGRSSRRPGSERNKR
jgi:tripartite-type tricarboxylate transporter receptor subunit TctC